ncbi:MAG TPA: hypothetical protein VLI07_17430 [Candidatus Binatus sp.]|jgi:Copper type II ascorbate-dependent monooxygenase, C-terminal domain|nr:hypothetical protein [Candidatus Binatus sp.]
MLSIGRVVASLAAVTLLAVPGSAGRVHLRHPPRGFQMRMGKFTVPPATEREVCEYRTFPNDKAMDVQQFEFKMNAGTHHFALWAYFGGDRNAADFPRGIVEAPGCIGLGPRDSFQRALLGGAPNTHELTRFPPGIAVRLEPHQPVFLNSHYINASLTDSLTPDILFNVIPAKKGSVLHHAENLTVGAYDIHIPAHSAASTTAEWVVPYDLNVIQLSSHEHKRGTKVTINLTAGGQNMGQIFENDDWDHPYEYWTPTPLHLRQGDVFRFTCNWTNNDDHPVTFGVTTDDEMCFMTGYYYRDDEATPPPSAPGCFLQDHGLLCSAAPVH